MSTCEASQVMFVVGQVLLLWEIDTAQNEENSLDGL